MSVLFAAIVFVKFFYGVRMFSLFVMFSTSILFNTVRIFHIPFSCGATGLLLS